MLKSKQVIHLGRYCIFATLCFVCIILMLTSYTLWLLRSEAMLSGAETAAMHSRRFEDFITQSLHVTSLIGANTLGQVSDLASLADKPDSFNRILRHAPFLRSLSVLDDGGVVISSSNSANLAIDFTLDGFLPPASDSLDILRIGPPWNGRDFADGYPGYGDDLAPRLIPIVRKIPVGPQTATLLIALNPDYFINHITQTIDSAEGTVEVIRYDGILLMSTDPEERPGVLRKYVLRELELAEDEIGEFAQTLENGQRVLTSFRASRLYPFVIVTHVKHNWALRYWRSEAKTLLIIVFLSLVAILLLVFIFYRRQLQLLIERAENERLQRINATVFDASTEATLIADPNAKIVSVNSAFTHVTGYRSAEVVGHALIDFIDSDDKNAFVNYLAESTPQIDDLTDVLPLEVRQRCKDGSFIWTEILATAAHNEHGVITGYYRISRNITARKQLEAQVKQMAFHDQLTNLPNRRVLSNYLELALATNKRHDHFGALLFLDLDSFKPLNDGYGHDVGDLLLIEVAKRLKNIVRESDIVVRFGGDEFVVLVNGLKENQENSIRQAGLVAEKIRTALAVPYVLNLSEIHQPSGAINHQCTASIGVCVFAADEQQDNIIKWADSAMYEAKEGGGNAISFYIPTN